MDVKSGEQAAQILGEARTANQSISIKQYSLQVQTAVYSD